jgi:hypothetical protein
MPLERSRQLATDVTGDNATQALIDGLGRRALQ